MAEIPDFFRTLLLLQFLFDHSEFFTGETSHIVPPYNKARIANFCLELQKLQKFQISLKRYSSFSSYLIILNFLLEKLGIQCHLSNKAGIANFCLELQKLQKFQISSKRYSSLSSYSIILNFLLEELGIQCHTVTKPEFQISAQNSRNCRNIAEISDFFKTVLLLQFLFDHSEIFTLETRHIVSPYNKGGISNFCLEFHKLQKFQISVKTLLLLQFLFDHSEFFTGETSHIVPPCNKAGIANF